MLSKDKSNCFGLFVWKIDIPITLLCVSFEKCSNCVAVFSCVQIFVTLWIVTHQAPLSMGFSRGGIIPFSSRSSRPMDQTQVSCITGRFFSISVTRKVLLLLSSHSVMSDFLWPLGLQPTSLPYLSVPPRAYSNSCLLSQWFHPIISSSVISFSSCPQSFPVLGSFPETWLFTSGKQSIGASASASVLPMNTQGTGLISLLVQGTVKSLLQHHNLKASILRHSAFFIVQLADPSICDYWKNHNFDNMPL